MRGHGSPGFSAERECHVDSPRQEVQFIVSRRTEVQSQSENATNDKESWSLPRRLRKRKTHWLQTRISEKRQREKAAVRRTEFDAKLVQEMTEIIRNAYPNCPSDEAEQIARHTALRGSGRVGRSAAGRELSADAINLAVRAWVRHHHTNYDELLMQGVERLFARQEIADDLNSKLREWEDADSAS